MEGLFFLDEARSQIIPAADKKSLPDPWVSCIAGDTTRHWLWVGTPSGIVRFNFGDLPLKVDPSSRNNCIPAKKIIINEETGDVFCLSYSNEIFRYALQEDNWENISLSQEINVKLTDLLFDNSKGVLWAATSKGIYGYNLKQNLWVRLPGYDKNISCLTLNSKTQALYFATDKGIHSNHLKERTSHLLLSNSPPFNNTVNAIAIEKKGENIWVGTDGGIAKFEKNKKQWRFFNLFPFPKDRVLALSKEGNNIWFGTMYHGLAKLDLKTGKTNEIKGLPKLSTVTSIVSDGRAKKVWLGVLGSRGGVYEYDIERQKLKILPLMDSLSVTSLLEDGDWIWVGTNKGVARFHKQKGPCSNPFEEQLSFNDVLTLALDFKRSHLWITTEYVVIKYDRNKEQVEIFDSASGFPRSAITSILFDGERIWLGSEGEGLFVYHPGENLKNPLAKIEGTGDRFIVSMDFDEKERTLWVGTVSGGISVIHWNNLDKEIPNDP
jgi:ligand-binding sensor domain-containing protein